MIALILIFQIIIIIIIFLNIIIVINDIIQLIINSNFDITTFKFLVFIVINFINIPEIMNEFLIILLLSLDLNMKEMKVKFYVYYHPCSINRFD